MFDFFLLKFLNNFFNKYKNRVYKKLSQNEKEELKQKLEKPVLDRKKTISENDLNKVAEIIEPFYDEVDWTDDWADYGFCELYLKSANLEANLESVMALAQVDRNVGWFMCDLALENTIFLYKAKNIILDEPVSTIFSLPFLT